MGRFVSATGQFLMATNGQFSWPPVGSFRWPLTVTCHQQVDKLGRRSKPVGGACQQSGSRDQSSGRKTCVDNSSAGFHQLITRQLVEHASQHSRTRTGKYRPP